MNLSQSRRREGNCGTEYKETLMRGGRKSEGRNRSCETGQRGREVGGAKMEGHEDKRLPGRPK